MATRNIPPEVLVFPQTLVERVTALLDAADAQRAAGRLLEDFFQLPADVRGQLLEIMSYLTSVWS